MLKKCKYVLILILFSSWDATKEMRQFLMPEITANLAASISNGQQILVQLLIVTETRYKPLRNLLNSQIDN
jgi:hypothetical protein